MPNPSVVGSSPDPALFSPGPDTAPARSDNRRRTRPGPGSGPAAHSPAPVYGSDLPRGISVTDLFQMVQQFQTLPPRSKPLRDQFFTAHKHLGGRRYLYSLLQPFLETGRVHARKGVVDDALLATATKVAEEKKNLWELTTRLPSTAMTLDILRERGELVGAGEVSPSYLNTIIRKRHLMRDLEDSPHVRVGCPRVRFCHFADSTGSMILKLRNDGRVEIGPAMDSRFLKNHTTEYGGRRSVYYVSFVDQYSGYVHGDLVTINNSGEAARIAREFWERWGVPEYVNVDRGSEFKSVFKLFCETNGIGFQPRGLRNKRAGGIVETVNLRIQQQFEMELLGIRGIGAILTLEEVREAFRAWLKRWNSRPCPRDSVNSRAALYEVPGQRYPGSS